MMPPFVEQADLIQVYSVLSFRAGRMGVTSYLMTGGYFNTSVQDGGPSREIPSSDCTNTMGRHHDEISPPPLKRRKVAARSSSPHGISTEISTKPAPPTEKQTIRLFSWNINGIDAFLPSQSTKITKFFKPSTSRSDASRTTDKRGQTASSLRAFLRRHNWPEILFLQEIKIKQGDTKTEASLLSSLNTPLDPTDNDNKEVVLAGDMHVDDDTRSYTLHTSLPRDKYNARGFGGKLYGVATILRADFSRRHVERVRYPAWDLEGRVSIVEMRKDDAAVEEQEDGYSKTECRPVRRPLALINVYAVNGTSAPYRSPRTGVVTGTRHDHKLAFHARLRDECLDLERSGFHVVVAGDLNVARGLWDGYPNLRTFPRQHCLNRANFNAVFFGEHDNYRAGAYVIKSGSGSPTGTGTGTGNGQKNDEEKSLDAVDVYRGIHGQRRKYTYFPRTKEWGSSCDRVDLIFVSKGLWQAGRVQGTDILDSPLERGPSDHVPIWAEIEIG